MELVTDTLKVIHILNAIFMAWPFYALVMVNHRAEMGPPLGDRLDVYIETVVKRRTIPCFVFQGVAMMTGLGLMLTEGAGFSLLFGNLVLALKFVMLIFIAVVLTYVHTRVQPVIDELFDQWESAPDDDIKAQIMLHRGRRKRFASICLFVVLLSAMLGVAVWSAFPLWFTLLLTAFTGFFTYRAYKATLNYGWF